MEDTARVEGVPFEEERPDAIVDGRGPVRHRTRCEDVREIRATDASDMREVAAEVPAARSVGNRALDDTGDGRLRTFEFSRVRIDCDTTARAGTGPLR